MDLITAKFNQNVVLDEPAGCLKNSTLTQAHEEISLRIKAKRYSNKSGFKV